MVTNFRWKQSLTILLLLGALILIATKPLTLGLDLAGGTYLRYSVADQMRSLPLAQRHDVIESVMDILRARVDGLGIKETPVRQLGADGVVVELPGSSEAESASVERVIESQGSLQFRLAAYDEPGIDTARLRRELDEFLTVKTDAERADRHLDLRALTDGLNRNQATFRWMPMSQRSMRGKLGEHHAQKQVEWVLVKIDPSYDLTGADLESVFPTSDEAGRPAVGFHVKSERADRMGQFTETNQGRSIAIVLDGEVESVAEIHSRIIDSGQIAGGSYGFSQDQMKHLLTVLKSGALPLKPVLEARSQIGPSLGEDSIRLGQISAAASLAIVALFMILYYRASGVIACLALVANLVLMVAVMILLKATLTLPGIAGIALTMGMAVDANILIHERMREERDKGKSVMQATKIGFERAFATIVDCHMTSFLASWILYLCGTGPIRGFAVTLILGIFTTLFTAITVSKLLFHVAIRAGWLDAIRMRKWIPETHIKFTRHFRACFIATGLLIVLGMTAFFAMGRDKYGLDLTGGYKATIQLKEETGVGTVRALVDQAFPGAEVVSVAGSSGASRLFQVKVKDIAANAEQSGQSIKAALRAKLGQLLVDEPITDLHVEPDSERALSNVQFTITYAADIAESIVLRNARGFLHDAVVAGADVARSFQVRGVYPAVVAADPLWAILVTNMKRDLPAIEINGKPTPATLSQPFSDSDVIGSRVGGELRDKAVLALCLAFLAQVIFVRIRFRGYQWGLAAALADAHDVFTTLAALSLARWLGLVHVEFDLTTVAVLLTIVGYSINDTIVIFDRIRENLPRMDKPLAEVIDLSVNQTLSRTLLTSLTVFLTSGVIFALNYGKGNVLEGFSFGMMFGVITGTFSSVYIASPIVLWIVNRAERKEMAALAAAA